MSPLFTGGKADWVCSITTISAPSNGTTAVYLPSSGGSISAGTDGSYDPRLDQFGIYADSTEAADAAVSLRHGDVQAFQQLGKRYALRGD